MPTRRAQIRITASRSPARGIQTGGSDLDEDLDVLPEHAALRATGPGTPETAAELGRDEARSRARAAPGGIAPPLHAPERLGGPRGFGFWSLAIRRAYEDGYRAEVGAQRRATQVLREIASDNGG